MNANGDLLPVPPPPPVDQPGLVALGSASLNANGDLLPPPPPVDQPGLVALGSASAARAWSIAVVPLKSSAGRLRSMAAVDSPSGAVDDVVAAGCGEALDALTDATASAKRTDATASAKRTGFAACILVYESWSRGLGREKREL